MTQKDDPISAKLNEVAPYFKNLDNASLDWTYLQEHLGMGKPADLPIVPVAMSGPSVTLEPTNARLKATFSTPYGDGILILYLGTFKATGYDPNATDWRLYFVFACDKEIPFSHIPAAGHMCGGGIWELMG